MNIDLVKIGNFLYEQRNKKGLTQEQLATIVGASFKTISKWECGGSFPDVIYQLPLCNALGISLKELQLGCLDVKERRKRKALVLFTKVASCLFVILIPLIIILLIFFISHVGKPKIYELAQDDPFDKQISINGILIESYKENYLVASNIDLYEYEPAIDDIISLDFYSNDTIIYHKNVIEPYILGYTYSNKISKKNLKLVISILKTDGSSFSYEVKLKVNDTIHLSKLLDAKGNYTYDDRKYKLMDYLLANGYKKGNDEEWVKTMKNNDTQTNISYYLLSDKISIGVISNETIESFVYYKKYNMLEVYIFSQSVSQVLIEKYTYDYNLRKIDCQVGVCSSYKKALSIMDEHITLLNGE